MDGAVLLVHDDQAVRGAASKALADSGFDVADAPELSAALEIAARIRAALLILPWLGRWPVREAITQVRDAEATRHCRVMVWANRADMGSAVAALELGADDCVAVPFAAAELVARINACLRRPLSALQPDRLMVGPLVLDKALHRLSVRDTEVPLSPAEFRLLAFLLQNQGRVFSREELLRGAWPKHISAGGRTVDVHVRRLRQLLEPFGCDGLIQTVRAFGYRLALPAELKPTVQASVANQIPRL